MKTEEKFPIIDGLDVIEGYMLYKGETVAWEHKDSGGKMGVDFKPLIEVALVHYNLKVNATNKLKVRFDLEKYFMRRNMMKDGCVLFSKDLYVKVAAINDKYRNENNNNL